MLHSQNIDNAITALVEKEPSDDKNRMGFDDFQLSEPQRRLVNKLVAIHGGGVLFRSKKRNNVELQIATPHLLETDGDKELTSRHLFVNIEKVVNEGHTKAAQCVKDGRVYDVRELLAMLPVEQRSLNIPKSEVKRRVSVVDKLKYMERDENGNLVPPGPGTLIPLDKLEKGHVARQYVESRGFDPEALVGQFDAAFCVKENTDMFYKKLPGGFRATPQGRIVFKINQLGINRGWQARRIEQTLPSGELMFWHPYREKWVCVGVKNRDGSVKLYDGFHGKHVNKAHNAILKQKYIIGTGVEKTTALMGFDAAYEWAKQENEYTIGLVEGVMDAARLGPPFVSMMGLTLSSNQASLISNHFSKVVYVPDNDFDAPEKSEMFCGSIRKWLESKNLELVMATVPNHLKDAGDMKPHEVYEFREKHQLL